MAVKKVSSLDKAFYLVERGYFPPETDVEKLAEEIERKSKEAAETPQILNDVNTVYHDKT